MIDQALLKYLEGYLTDRRKTLFEEVLKERTRHFTVVLEDIYQAHNASAVVRSCDIFGIQDVYAIENMYVNKVSRHVAKGSQKWLDFHRFNRDTNNTKDCLNALRSNGYQIIGTTPHNDSCMLADFDITKKSAFVFGVEKEGISDYVKQEADGFLKIPMVGFTESLNISVAAAIILQDVTTRLKKSEVLWKLSEEEKEKIYFEWVQKTIKNVDKIKAHYYQNKEKTKA
ncbi:TrmH family RNA methyltransferase [Tenacibaculum maritimum]|uniref:TrmH family RNA methyltransferase n=1 Tax=Tenacibaculum maritimum TaxID=107401 RepID=UPI0003FA415B|nr:RNA methyltransferase [Tenacibaculum maritimum]MCD9610516.1 RNA methyltransferase [Tenacibaculum maritimum]QCD61980.1 rRNA methyltransferase [Tenacibaculum maritimum]CAA0146512.1 putative tRNA methyltransferase (tRNA mG18-2'-O-methyltransferase) [Tenacibaculum maritimum]CAA0146535.1 putative tRNA methyltransferase (tRNA mG18-2'-O-methyltransferase) [Tenacibaculum maritimum]CAA0153701.1 putative tRNA methyltransferase (tRNA mG18-2'-O-methyltransferase) [Tenacibaculum maritimum]